MNYLNYFHTYLYCFCTERLPCQVGRAEIHSSNWQSGLGLCQECCWGSQRGEDNFLLFGTFLDVFKVLCLFKPPDRMVAVIDDKSFWSLNYVFSLFSGQISWGLAQWQDQVLTGWLSNSCHSQRGGKERSPCKTTTPMSYICCIFQFTNTSSCNNFISFYLSISKYFHLL